MTYTSNLDEFADHLFDALDTAAREIAETVEDKAKARVPVGTGRLRDAIHVERIDKGEYSVVAGDSHVFYGHVVEHGDSNTPPRPFLVPALEESRDMIKTKVVDAIRRL